MLVSRRWRRRPNGPVAAGNQGGRLTERTRSTGTALDRPAACQRKSASGGQGGRHHAERKQQERSDMSFAKAESFQTRDARNMTISLTPFRTIRALTPNLPLTHPDRTLSLRGERLRVRGVSAFSFLAGEAGFLSRGKEPCRMNRGEDQGSRSSSPSLSPPRQRQVSVHYPTGLTSEVTRRWRDQVRIYRVNVWGAW